MGFAKQVLYMTGIILLIFAGILSITGNSLSFVYSGVVNSPTNNCSSQMALNTGTQSGNAPLLFSIRTFVSSQCEAADGTNPIDFGFNWGDGSSITHAQVFGPGTNCVISGTPAFCSATQFHTFNCNSPTSYTVTATANDNFGDTGYLTAVITLTGGCSGQTSSSSSQSSSTISGTVTVTLTRTITTTINGNPTTITQTQTITAPAVTTTRTRTTTFTQPGTTISRTDTDTTTFFQTATTTVGGLTTVTNTVTDPILGTYTTTVTTTVSGSGAQFQFPAFTNLYLLTGGIASMAIAFFLPSKKSGRT